MTRNWQAIEADYRAGRMGIREIARFHDVPESTIRKRASANQWQRTARHITAAEIREAGAPGLAARVQAIPTGEGSILGAPGVGHRGPPAFALRPISNTKVQPTPKGGDLSRRNPR